MGKTETATERTPGALDRHGLSDEQLRAIFRNMLLQRQLDNRGFQLNRQGKVRSRSQRGPRSAAGRRGDGVHAR